MTTHRINTSFYAKSISYPFWKWNAIEKCQNLKLFYIIFPSRECKTLFVIENPRIGRMAAAANLNIFSFRLVLASFTENAEIKTK